MCLLACACVCVCVCVLVCVSVCLLECMGGGGIQIQTVGRAWVEGAGPNAAFLRKAPPPPPLVAWPDGWMDNLITVFGCWLLSVAVDCWVTASIVAVMIVGRSFVVNQPMPPVELWGNGRPCRFRRSAQRSRTVRQSRHTAASYHSASTFDVLSQIVDVFVFASLALVAFGTLANEFSNSFIIFTRSAVEAERVDGTR